MAEPPLWSTLLGPVIKDSHQEEHDTDVILGGIQIVGIYFANRKIARSPRFKPHLKNFYDKVNKDGQKKFEVVVASFDKTMEDYLFSFPEKSQWFALPFGSALVKKLDIKLEPPGGFAMTVVTSDGEVVRQEGDGDILRDKGGKRSFQKWLGDATIGAPPKKEGPKVEEAEDAGAEAAEEAEAEGPPPTNAEGQVLYWTAEGAEGILPSWKVGQWRTMPVNDNLLSAAQVRLIGEKRFLIPRKNVMDEETSPPEQVMRELQARGWVTPEQPTAAAAAAAPEGQPEEPAAAVAQEE